MTSKTPAAGLWSATSSYHKVKLAFLAAAFASFVLSVTVWFLFDREVGLFVGLWVPAIHSWGPSCWSERIDHE